MSLTRTTATKNLALDAAYDRGSGMKLKIYSGTPPADANASLSGNTLLASLTLANTPFSAASSGAKSAGSITSDTDADATGTATFFRLTKSDDTVVCQGTVGTSGADLNLNSVSIVQHTTVSCSSFVITAGV